MLVVAIAGLAVNIVVFVMLREGAQRQPRGEERLVDAMADAAGSVGVIVAAVVVAATGWDPIDPIVAIADRRSGSCRARGSSRPARCACCCRSRPRTSTSTRSAASSRALPGVVDVHDLHVWTLTSEMDVASAHVMIGADADAHAVLDQARALLLDARDRARHHPGRARRPRRVRRAQLVTRTAPEPSAWSWRRGGARDGWRRRSAAATARPAPEPERERDQRAARPTAGSVVGHLRVAERRDVGEPAGHEQEDRRRRARAAPRSRRPGATSTRARTARARSRRTSRRSRPTWSRVDAVRRVPVPDHVQRASHTSEQRRARPRTRRATSRVRLSTNTTDRDHHRERRPTATATAAAPTASTPRDADRAVAVAELDGPAVEHVPRGRGRAAPPAGRPGAHVVRAVVVPASRSVRRRHPAPHRRGARRRPTSAVARRGSRERLRYVAGRARGSRTRPAARPAGTARRRTRAPTTSRAAVVGELAASSPRSITVTSSPATCGVTRMQRRSRSSWARCRRCRARCAGGAATTSTPHDEQRTTRDERGAGAPRAVHPVSAAAHRVDELLARRARPASGSSRPARRRSPPPRRRSSRPPA